MPTKHTNAYCPGKHPIELGGSGGTEFRSNEMQVVLAYLGPGVGIGGLVLVVGFLVALLFLVYAFVYLPLKQSLRKKSNENHE